MSKMINLRQLKEVTTSRIINQSPLKEALFRQEQTIRLMSTAGLEMIILNLIFLKTLEVEVIALSKTNNFKLFTFFEYFFQGSPLSMRQIIAHFASDCGIPNKSITVLLKLLKKHKPDPCYDSLPSEGKNLLKIDGRDYPVYSRPTELPQNPIQVLQPVPPPGPQTPTPDNPAKKKRKRPPPVQPTIKVGESGEYCHFGLENSLLGDSPGLYFKYAQIVQFAAIYKINPQLLPKPIRDQVIKKLHN